MIAALLVGAPSLRTDEQRSEYNADVDQKYENPIVLELRHLLCHQEVASAQRHQLLRLLPVQIRLQRHGEVFAHRARQHSLE